MNVLFFEHHNLLQFIPEINLGHSAAIHEAPSPMKVRSFIALAISILMASCSANLRPSEINPGIQLPTGNPITTSEAFSTSIPTSTPNTLNEVRWNIYDPDPQHLWNRLFRHFYRRTTNDGREYGWDSLDPLLWYDTTHVLEGTSYQQAISVLDEFISAKDEDLITDPLLRAIFQRDMWAVFDWLTLRLDSYPAQSEELQWRLAQVIRKVALTKDEILSLPDNYEAAIKSKSFAPNYQSQAPDIGFLPADLLQLDSEWICLGREGGPIAMTHTEEFPFFGRSVFLVFIRVPGGREATLKFLQELNEKRPLTLQLADTDVALVRRAMLINNQGDITPSPITESVQIRHFAYVGVSFATQNFYEFQLNRGFLFVGAAGGLQPLAKEIMLFRSHDDVFQTGLSVGEVLIPGICASCHAGGTLSLSILSYSRFRFPLPDQGSPVLIQTTPELEAQKVIIWKNIHQTWQALETLWGQGTP